MATVKPPPISISQGKVGNNGTLNSGSKPRLRRTPSNKTNSSADPIEPILPQVTNANVKMMYEHLHNLSMPQEITLEAFEQLLNHGNGNVKWNDVLISLSNKLVGRQDVWKTRDIISRARSAHCAPAQPKTSTSKIKAQSSTTFINMSNHSNAKHLLEDPIEAALSRRENAYRGLIDGVKKEYDAVRREMTDLDNDRKALEMDLAYKQHLDLLMHILEKREAIRLDRLGPERGLGALLDDVHKKVHASTKNLEHVQVACLSPEAKSQISSRTVSSRRKETISKYPHTTEALATLHALHIKQRRSRSSNSVAIANRESVGKRLEAVLIRLGMGNDDKAIKLMTQQLNEVARRRVEAKNRALFLKNKQRTEQVDLDEMYRSVERKKIEVQQIVNRAVGLGWLCQENIDLLSTFRQETAPVLSNMLENERRRTQGYIDTLRIAIKESQTKALDTARRKSFVQEVRDILGTGRTDIVQDVRNIMERVAKSESLVKLNQTAAIGTGDGTEEETVRKYVTQGQKSEERIQKLLERKGKKADYGFEVAKEINTLLADCRRLK